MSLIQYYTATSLDGYIADPDNSLDWLFTRQREDDGPLSYGRFIADIGAMAMGSTTYRWILDHEFAEKPPAEWKWPYDIPCWVFTHRQLRVVPHAANRVHERGRRKRAQRDGRRPLATGTSGCRRGRPGRAVRRRGSAGRDPRADRAGYAVGARLCCPAGSSCVWTSSRETATSPAPRSPSSVHPRNCDR